MASDRMMEYYYSMGQENLSRNQLEEAITYFRKAANLGAEEAAHEIGVIGHRYETAEGVPADEEKAARCYRMSADFGIKEAWYYLDDCTTAALREESRTREKRNGPSKELPKRDTPTLPFSLPKFTTKASWGRSTMTWRLNIISRERKLETAKRCS